jgi:hypothetical protein
LEENNVDEAVESDTTGKVLETPPLHSTKLTTSSVGTSGITSKQSVPMSLSFNDANMKTKNVKHTVGPTRANVGKSITAIADAVTTNSGNNNQNMITYLEHERIREERREAIRQQERIDEMRRLEMREDRREREDAKREERFQLLMFTLMGSRQPQPYYASNQSASIQSSPGSNNGL